MFLRARKEKERSREKDIERKIDTGERCRVIIQNMRERGRKTEKKRERKTERDKRSLTSSLLHLDWISGTLQIRISHSLRFLLSVHQKPPRGNRQETGPLTDMYRAR